jgi:hypothetical protein
MMEEKTCKSELSIDSNLSIMVGNLAKSYRKLWIVTSLESVGTLPRQSERVGGIYVG